VIAETLSRAQLALASWPLTLAAVAASIAFGLAGLAIPLFGSALIAGLMLPSLIALLVISFFLARRAGAATEDEVESFGRWFGWGILASIPPIILALIYGAIVGFENWVIGEYKLWLESALLAAGAILAMPLFALSTGRAIDCDGIGASVVFAYCKDNVGPILVAGLILLLGPNILADAALDMFGAEHASVPTQILFGIVAGLSFLAVNLATISLSATIYRNAEKSASSGLHA
jgi:hypothetical protein